MGFIYIACCVLHGQKSESKQSNRIVKIERKQAAMRTDNFHCLVAVCFVVIYRLLSHDRTILHFQQSLPTHNYGALHACDMIHMNIYHYNQLWCTVALSLDKFSVFWFWMCTSSLVGFSAEIEANYGQRIEWHKAVVICIAFKITK